LTTHVNEYEREPPTLGATGAQGSTGNRRRRGAIARRDQFIDGVLGRLPRDALVVNVGCGVVRRFDPKDTSRYLATDLRALPNVDFSSDASALPMADGSVDAIVALELLEHVARPTAVLQELGRVLKPGGTVIVSVPSAVPRHDTHDYWRFTAEGLGQLCSEVFENGEVHVFGGTFEALGYLLGYYTALVFHQARIPSRRVADGLGAVGHWLDRRNSWSTSTTALHTLAFDLLFVATAQPAAH
jgi:SAM-dependent methyltransferase